MNLLLILPSTISRKEECNLNGPSAIIWSCVVSTCKDAATVYTNTRSCPLGIQKRVKIITNKTIIDNSLAFSAPRATLSHWTGDAPPGGGGTRSGKVRVCEARPQYPLPFTILWNRHPLPFAPRCDMHEISGPFQQFSWFLPLPFMKLWKRYSLLASHTRSGQHMSAYDALGT